MDNFNPFQEIDIAIFCSCCHKFQHLKLEKILLLMEKRVFK